MLDPCPTTQNRWLVEKRANGWKTFIAEVYGDPDHQGGKEWQGSREANAKLIANAPLLLEQRDRLRETLKALLFQIDREPDRTQWWLKNVRDNARMALAETEAK